LINQTANHNQQKGDGKMAQDNEVQGDVIQIPQEFILLKDQYMVELSKKLISLTMLRKQPGMDYLDNLDNHMEDLASIKGKIREVDEMINSIKNQQQPTGVDND
jgi:hypothetical protein